jgi:hypothetical protein
MSPGFFRYKEKHLPKVNALREANSLVQITGVPVLTKGQLLFSPASESNGEPRSCYNCDHQNETSKTCKLLGPAICTEKFVYPASGEKRIEYWPVCGYWYPGEPTVGIAKYAETLVDPDDAGLVWINAPEIGAPAGGSSCGGAGNGDDCDNWLVEGNENKRNYTEGFCRVLQVNTNTNDCCTAWGDDDEIMWQKAQDLLRDLKQTKEPNPFLGK